MNDELCIDCYKQKIFLPYSSSIEEALTVEEMKNYLKEHNRAVSNTDNIEAHEIQELYEICKVDEKREMDIGRNVPFPIYPSNSLDIVREEDRSKKYGFGKILLTFDLHDGGRFICDPQIKNQLVEPVINLLAATVRYDENRKQYTDFNSNVYDVMPDIFVEFANSSRVSAGFRLLKRCLRHALDPKTHPLMEQSASFFIHDKDGELGLVLKNKINERYRVSSSSSNAKKRFSRC